MRARTSLVLLWLALGAGAACTTADDSGSLYELTGSTMGTAYTVKVIDRGAEPPGEELQAEVETLLSGLNDRFSTYREDSELSRFNASNSDAWVTVSKELCDVVDAALTISETTAGAFDVTVGPLVNLWGFGPDGSVSVPPHSARVEEAAGRVGYNKLQADCSRPALKKSSAALYVDLSAFAKGYAVDRIADLLDDRGFGNYLVEVGGELKLRGKNARAEDWNIAIEKPAVDRRTVQKIVALSDTALATSGDYRNFFEHAGQVYSHTIDPRTGYPVTHAGAAVTVLAESAAFADGMATALLVLGPDEGMDLALRENLAVLFLVRVDDRIVETASKRFSSLLESR